MKKTRTSIIICTVLAVVLITCSSTSFAAGRELFYGTSGDDVLELQYLLADEGYFYDEPTGYFGEITEAALIEYQYDMGIEADGVAGPVTQELLGFSADPSEADDSEEAEPSDGTETEAKPVQSLSFTRTMVPGMEGTDVTALQQLLAIFGYFEEEPTGFFGDLTTAAVIAFQEERGLEADGIVGEMTLNALITTPQEPEIDEAYSDYADRVLDAINRTPATSAGYCAAWVTQVMENAGILTYNIHSLRPTGLSYAVEAGLTDSWYSDSTGFNANDYWAYVCNSSNIGDLEVGMVVASRNSFSYLGRQFGHVGIYIGDGQVISSVGYLETLSLDEWIQRYNNDEMGSTVAWGYLPL